MCERQHSKAPHLLNNADTVRYSKVTLLNSVV